ncbi:hypothetical protein Glove_180g126 [Diversispora epigaea]|uniref:Uncharacterized protein n=1 Tax=Diversispora epigaea TaxID=1348612 RepID=A0A397IWY9_9GLOM|nr:hypothetical protein Glove_180g126 [Diversispora epigaea]
MFNERLSDIPEPPSRQYSNNDDNNNNNNNENQNNGKSKIKSFLKTHVLIPFQEEPAIWVAMFSIFFSTFLLLILLMGGSKSIYLSRFTFEEPIKYITKKNEITFTLYGYCIDDQCSVPSMLHSFDQMPSSSEISSSNNNKKRLDVPDVVEDTTTGVTDTVTDTTTGVTDTVTDTTTEVTDTVTDTAKDIIDKAPQLLEGLKDSLDSFTPKIPSVNISGFISLPYLFAMLLNMIALFLLYFDIFTPAILIILISTILNLLGLIFNLLLFVWVFELIALMPGIGDHVTGPGIHMEAWSFLFLTIATITLIGKFGKNIISVTCKCVSRGIRNIKDKISKRNEKDDDEKEMVEAV